MIVKEKALVIGQEEIAEDIFDLTLAVSFAKECRSGQFVSLYMDDCGFLLPRPISLCGIGQETIRLVYRIAGKGTKAFSKLKSHDTVEVMGPLGNGFPLEVCDGKTVILTGGGIGIPPMLEAGRAILERNKAGAVSFVMGYRSEPFLKEDFLECLEDFRDSRPEMAADALYVATEDGSSGVRGTVLDAISQESLKADVIFACGPAPMLRALKNYAKENNIELYVSLEEKMACGVGACLGCVCESAEVDAHSHVHNKRICKDGPVFKADDIII